MSATNGLSADDFFWLPACSCTHACLSASIAQAGRQAARPPYVIRGYKIFPNASNFLT